MSASPTIESRPDNGQIRETVDQACNPIAQNWPMKIFAYRNPLRGLEHLPFDEAIQQGKHLLGGSGYLPNEDYRQLFRDGTITQEAVSASIERAAGEIASQTVSLAGRSIASRDVLRLHLLYGFEALDPALLGWQLSAGGATDQFRRDLPADLRKHQNGDDAYLTKLWDSTLAALNLSDEEPDEPTEDVDVDLPAERTISDWLDQLSGTTLVDQINDQMIKWTAAFLDEGMAGWEMPGRGGGFYQAWRELAPADYSGRLLGIKRFGRKVRELPDEPDEAVATGLDQLEIPLDRRTEYLSRMLAQLPGWSGYIRWLSDNPDYPHQKIHPIDPLQYLAVRLFYEVELVQTTCQRTWRIDGTLSALRGYWNDRADEYQTLVARNNHAVDRRTQAICRDAWRLFHLAQFLGLTPRDVEKLGTAEAKTLLDWLGALPADRHGPVWLVALETSFRDQLIERLAADGDPTSTSEERLRAQLVLCIDARSESFRRHIEDQGPYETFGFAGFFGIPIRHQAFDSAGHAALCPVIVAPQIDVAEVPRSGEDQPLENYASGSRWNQLGEHLFHDLKRNPIGSFMLISVMGLFFSLRLIGKTFFQRPYGGIKNWLLHRYSHPVDTQIPVDLADEEPPDEPTPVLPHGFTVEQQATFVEKGLRAFGLTKNFARFVVLCGHGSTSENNPYFAAYNCGACGGGHGDPNARVFAAMANKPAVRRALKDYGLDVPDDTWFLAGKHNTVTDQVSLYDVEDIPKSHHKDLRLLKQDLREGGGHQALERCHRIPQAPTEISPEEASDHMVARSFDWANVRPEWGLSSNAAFVLGRRALTRGRDLGGRVFLHSYDPDADTEGAILEALMMAPMVVAQWISMEYYFSAVDPGVYGSGSKVTHNVVSGVGVMHGAHGDLQTGLPLQSVNDGPRHYHQPVRLLVLIEAPTERISAAIEKHTLLGHLLHNQWIHLMAIDPATRAFERYHPDATWKLIA